LGGKSSVAKLNSILARTCDDGQLRGAFVANATSTGRLVSFGVQLHNLPRECLKDYDARILQMEEKLDPEDEVISFDRHKPGKIVTVPSGPLTIKEISTAIRGVIIPDHEDDVYVDADFNAIEARGVGWLAGANRLTDLFASGGDPYCAIACVIYLRKITKADEDERFVGKQTILGCGYGMGAPKFEAQCIKFGKPVGQAVSKKAVQAYRDDYAEIPKLWKGLEYSAIQAIKNPGRITGYRDIEFKVSQGFLKMRLPSGRLLYYAEPRLMEKRAPWDSKLLLPVVSYMAEHPMKKVWCRETTWGGKLTENAVQALCGDLLWEAKLRLEKRGIGIRLSVHDQVVVQAPRRRADEILRIVKTEMERGEWWAKGFPIKAEPKIMQRFGK
jgi:DNA polymerase